MINIKGVDNERLWEDFVTKTPHTPFSQSFTWGNFQEKMGKKVWWLGIFEGTTLLGVALLVKQTTKLGSYFSCPDGPVIRNPNEECVQALRDFLIDLGKQEGCAFVRLDPRIEDTQKSRDLFKKSKFHPSAGFSEVEYGWVLGIAEEEEKLLLDMRKTTRYEIRRGEKEKVEVWSSKNPDDVDLFWELLTKTAQRKGFKTFSREYLKTQFELFGARNQALLFFAKSRGEIRSAAYLMLYGDTATYLHGASIKEGSKSSASYLLQWEAVREAKKRRLRYYDFWGVIAQDNPNHPWYGISLFKKGFGGYLIPYLISQDKPLDYRYYLIRGFELFRKFKQGT